MSTCEYLDLEADRSPTVPHRVRCRWCGDERIMRTEHPEWLKGRRFCNVVRPPDEIQPEQSHGLGDSVAKALHAARLDRVAQFLRLCGGGCAERQAWLNRIWPYKTLPPIKVDRPQILLGFEHGFGDAVQFTVVLRHLQKHRPTWEVDVQTLKGHDGLFRALCRQVFTGPVPEAEKYHQAEPIQWLEPHCSYESCPSTKIEKCLQQIFSIAPDPELMRYVVHTTEEQQERADYWLGTLAPRGKDGRFDVVAIHYQGNSSQANKNLEEGAVRQLIELVKRHGYVPLLLDWETRSPLLEACPLPGPPLEGLANFPNGHELWDGQASQVVALLERCRGFLGIDSGPGHAVGATDTPAILTWRWHHPVHYYPPVDNVLHVVRHDHESSLRPENAALGARYFAQHYPHVVCTRDLSVDLLDVAQLWFNGELARARAEGLSRAGGFWIRAHRPEADRLIIRDVHHEDSYGVLQMKGLRRVLDVGAHIGTFAVRVHDAFPRAEIACVEPDPANAAVLERNAGDFATAVFKMALFDRPIGYLRSSVGTDNSGASEVAPVGTAEQRVEGRTLTEFCDALGWDQVDLLKLDCEGAELVALADPALERCDVVVGEVHDEPAFRAAATQLPPHWLVELLRHPTNPGGLPLFRLTRR